MNVGMQIQRPATIMTFVFYLIVLLYLGTFEARGLAILSITLGLFAAHFIVDRQ